MSDKLLLEPKCILPPEYKDRKVFFLAGPIQGGDGWQMKAAEILWREHPGCIVVDPTRWENREEMTADEDIKAKIREYKKNAIGIKSENLYITQNAWEDEYMDMASKKGTLFFWLEKESEISPREYGAYAQDTRVEIGIWLERVKNNPELKVKIGGKWEIDEKGKETKNSFGGMNFIVYYLTKEQDRRKVYNGEIKNPHLVLAKSLEDFLEKSLVSEIAQELKPPKISMN